MIMGDIAVQTLCAPCGASVEIRLSRINGLPESKGPAIVETITGPDLTPTLQVELAMRINPEALNTGAKYSFRAKAQGALS